MTINNCTITYPQAYRVNHSCTQALLYNILLCGWQHELCFLMRKFGGYGILALGLISFPKMINFFSHNTSLQKDGVEFCHSPDLN